MTPAETLRAAAARLRELAGEAAEGAWRSRTVRGWLDVVSDAEHCVTGVAMDLVPEDAAWIVALSPAIAEPLAAWLESTARYMEVTGLRYADAVALATAILEAAP